MDVSAIGLQGGDVTRVLDRSAASSPGLEALGREFAELLAQPASRHVPEVGAETALGAMVHQHERLYQGFVRDLRSATQEVQGMSLQQASIKQVEMMFRAAEVHMQHTAISSVAQSTKNGVQTLVKNQ